MYSKVFNKTGKFSSVKYAKYTYYISSVKYAISFNSKKKYGARNLEIYNFSRLNDFIDQKCLKLKLRSAFVPT